MTKNKTTARCVCAKYPRTTPPPPQKIRLSLKTIRRTLLDMYLIHLFEVVKLPFSNEELMP